MADGPTPLDALRNVWGAAGGDPGDLDHVTIEGPWAGRRGFDSLVQTASGIVMEGTAWAQSERPMPLPAQALDHATGISRRCLRWHSRRSMATHSGYAWRWPHPHGARHLLRQPGAEPRWSLTT